MKIKFSKNKKIILLITGLGILTTSIVTPILVINNKNKENKQIIVESNAKQNSEDLNKINEIILKIKNKDILIPVSTSYLSQNVIQNEIKDQNEIKKQLKKKNQSLNEDDLLKINIKNIGSLTPGEKVKIILIIKERNTSKELTINVEQINLWKNLNRNDTFSGTLFEDSFGNIWAMGHGKKLQVLKVNPNGNSYETTGWTNNNSERLLIGSNIVDSLGGTIFQDSFKNLWTMGKGTPLQVLKVNPNGNDYVTTGWTNNNSQRLLNGSNITDGVHGILFQDSFKNLWTMGNGTPLQVLKVNQNNNGYLTTGWTNVTIQGLLKGSNILNGGDGTIFQDSFKNLWTMGKGTPLQVLKVNQNNNGYVTTGWTDDINQGLTNGSNINNGFRGTIFQDSFKNLWTMGLGTKLQVLKAKPNGNGYVVTGWTDNNWERLLNGSNITNGGHGKIFQDSFENLWAISGWSKLQVLKAKPNGNGYVITGWNNNTKELLNRLNINNGFRGTIFQDSYGNIWKRDWSPGFRLKVFLVKLDGDNNYLNS